MISTAITTARIINSLLCFLIAAVTTFLHHSSDELVASRGAALLDYTHVVDLRVYDQPFSVVAGSKVAEIERQLRASNFGECKADSRPDLVVLPPRIVCKRGGVLAVRSFAPFKDYTFELDRKAEAVRSIRTVEGVVVDEALLPSPVSSAVNFDAEGNTRERVRYDLMLGREIDSDSLPIKFFIEIEDRRFFEHGGNDWRGIGRASYRSLLVKLGLAQDETLQGGSSITEQVAKLLFLPNENKVLRRVRSLFLAESLEQRLTKRQILELWLNLTVMGLERPTENHAGQRFGQRREMLRGFKTAARVLFSKELGNCTPGELAVLAVLPRHPRVFPELKKGDNEAGKDQAKFNQRRRKALETFAAALEKSGRKDVAVRFSKAVGAPVRFVFDEDDLKGDEALVTFLENDMKAQFGAHRPASADRGDDAMREPLVVLTTVDREFQRALSQSIEAELPGIKSQLVRLTGADPDRAGKKARGGFSFEVQAEAVALSAEDGGLRALSSLKTSGGRVTPNRANVNPPSFAASCAKPLVFAHALGEGVITPQTKIRPSECEAPGGFRFDGAPDDRSLPLSDHLIASRNPPFICVGNRLGIGNVLAKWRELFPDSKQSQGGFVPHPYQLLRGLNRSEAEVSPTALAEAYTALARQGERQSLRVIDSIYAGGKKIPLDAPAGRRVFKPEAAVLTASLLRAGTRTLTRWRPAPGFDLALKTGSSSNTYWVVMFSPKLVVVVRYLIVPAMPLGDERAAQAFSNEVARRFAHVFSGNVVKPFADSILKVIQQKRRGWLRGSFSHANVVTLRIDPVRDCAVSDDSGVTADFIRGTQPEPCPAEAASATDEEP